MDSNDLGNGAATKELIGTYDFAKPTEVLREIDRGMRIYFGADDWIAARRKLLPGFNR